MCEHVPAQRSIQEALSTSTAAGGDPNPRPTGYSTNLIAVYESAIRSELLPVGLGSKSPVAAVLGMLNSVPLSDTTVRGMP